VFGCGYRTFPKFRTLEKLFHYQEVIAEEPGYFYIYLNNEETARGGGEAFSRNKFGTSFDDFTIQTKESYIVQTIDYYPYGMVARNWTRVGDRATRDLFQGKSYDDLTKWYDFHARQYDAALGRWFAVDPQNQFASPYTGMGNNPVMMVDPDGELAWFVPIIIGAAIFGTGNVAVQASNGNINNFWDGVKAFGAGAVTGAVVGAT
jgi:RHS repeat-associated protein